MLAPGGQRNARGDRGRSTKGPAPQGARKSSGPEVTLTQAMSAGKWELLVWLGARAKTASEHR